MFIILSGSSGAGKNTIINELIKRNPKLRFLKSCTTRSVVRDDEVGTSPYIRISKEEFNKKIKNGELFEHEEIHGDYYGILNESINEIIAKKNDFIKDVGVLGQKNMVDKIGNKVKIISIFLEVPKEELIRRLKLRGENNIEKRLARFDFEYSHIPNYDLIIPNDDMNKTIQIIEGILKNKKV
ncbi:MAG: AAA family ATPase [Clostridia bacterium]|nr:AAA family ATPase [Clostridia bacterium]